MNTLQLLTLSFCLFPIHNIAMDSFAMHSQKNDKYVSCKVPHCGFRCLNDANMLKAHQDAHKEADGQLFRCSVARCNAWFYTTKKLNAHKRKKHAIIVSLSRTKKEIKKDSKLIPYKLFCALEAKVKSPFIGNVATSTSAFKTSPLQRRTIKKKVHFQTMWCECCQQSVTQHSYKLHVLENHPHIYDYNHISMQRLN